MQHQSPHEASPLRQEGKTVQPTEGLPRPGKRVAPGLTPAAPTEGPGARGPDGSNRAPPGAGSGFFQGSATRPVVVDLSDALGGHEWHGPRRTRQASPLELEAALVALHG